MEKSNLIYTLQTFDKKELRELGKWLQSPAHNQREDVAVLFDYLSTGEHLFSEKHLAKPKAYAATYPERTYSDAEMRQVMHFLYKAVEEFLVYNELRKDEVRSAAALAKVYRQRQLPKLFKRAMDAGRKLQAQQPLRNSHFFENEYLLQFEEYSYLSGLGRDVPLNLQEVSDANDVAFLANKLKLSCIMRSHQAVFKSEYQLHLLDGLLEFVEGHPGYLDIPAISIYYFSFKAISEKQEEGHFQELKKRIRQHSSLFPPDEMRVILLLAINYCIGQINAGKEAYFRESFELYELGMLHDIFLENGVLSRFTFGNSISIALNLKEFKWVERQLGESSQKLEEKHRENYVRFYQARLYFERGEYEHAMRLLAQYESDDILMNLLAKTMLLKMYYELDEFPALDSLIESMRTYLQRKKVMGYHRTVFKNLLSFVKKLLKILPHDREQVAALRKEVQTAEPLMERKWLLEQLEKM